MKTLVIIPCYNESQNICQVVENLRAACPQVDYLVVNDCSTDNSVEILRALLHFEVVANLVFTLLFCFVLLVLLILSAAASQHTERITRLTQQSAMLEQRVRLLEQRLEALEEKAE